MSEETSNRPPPLERTETDTTGEFFSVGAPLHAVRAGYVSRKADQLLYDAVVSGRYAHVLAPARSGKSSLVAATAARLEGHGHKVAILDLEQIGVRDSGGDPGRWYYNVAYRLLRQLRIRYDLQTWWHDRSMLSNRQRLLEFYSEVVLQFVSEHIVVFVDEIQCIQDVPSADQLLASIRSAHNARTTDPDFSRLTFALLGECDPVSLVSEPELSPFNVTQQVTLDDFSREEIDLFATELSLEPGAAEAALDRIYYWTRGQPYLTQKMARQVARDDVKQDVSTHVDHIATTQIAGRAALHNEPHMSHIHRVVVEDAKREALLTLYGKVRKGIEVPADLASSEQRRLMSVGLVEVDHDGNLRVRNRLYAAVFTARWANENLPTRLRVPLVVVGVIALFVLLPFWYTQWLPRPYMDMLTSPTLETGAALTAYENLRSFPGHADTADSLFRGFVEMRAGLAADETEAREIAELSSELPAAGRLPDALLAGFWDRQASAALRNERRDEALIATLESLVMSTPHRRQRAANLVSDDYPLLGASLPAQPATTMVFDHSNLLLTLAEGARVSQWSYATQSLQRRESWSMTALEVVPLVRRVAIDRGGTVSRVGLTLTLSHARLSDLRIKIIAPSGRTVEIETGRERASSNEDLRIPAAQLQDLVGESLTGTWSISVRDEALGVAGQLVGWNLKLNSQGAIEEFQRGLNIPDPVERETDSVWFDATGRYAVARAMQSDSARIWDLAYAEPVRVIAINESERLIGLDAGARHMLTATQNSVSLWDTSTGDRTRTLETGAASSSAILTKDGAYLFVEYRGDAATRLERWSLESGAISAELEVAGVPALIVIDPTGSRIAVADYDRAVRVWDVASGELVAQVDLPVQPSALHLASGGDALGVVHDRAGVSLWNLDRPQQALLEEFADGNWNLVFAPSGTMALAGRAEAGYQLYSTTDGRLAGPPIGVREGQAADTLLAFGADEQVIVTGNLLGQTRFWKVPEAPRAIESESSANLLWQPSADRVTVALPGARKVVIGDTGGHVHVMPASGGTVETQARSEDLSYLGHSAAVTRLAVNRDGSLVASAAADNSIRVWETELGKPRAFSVRLEGDNIRELAFSPDLQVLAALQSSALTLLDLNDGTTVAEFDLGEPHRSMEFAASGRVFVGSDSGVLRQAGFDPDGAWTMQRLWQGVRPVTRLAHSRRGDYLIIVDDAGAASQFMLAEGHIGELQIDFPGPVEDIVFSRSGARAYFRTARWVHRVSVSTSGLRWIDGVFTPPPLQGARIVHGDADAARRVYMPAARNGVVELVELAFPGSSQPGLLGNYEELLGEWRKRLGVQPVSPD
jgi:WD40 repeat protein